MHVLVAGGSGMLGRPVVRALIEAGHSVRVLSRQSQRPRGLPASVQIASGDVMRPATLPAAVAGCEALHVSLRGADDWEDCEAVERDGLASLLRAARAGGVAHVSYLSGAGHIAGHEHLRPIAIKLAAEKLIAESGIAFTILRATHFMESLRLFVAGRRATIIGPQPHVYRYLAAGDFAHLITRALVCPESRGKTLYAFGPEGFTMQEALARYLRRVHPGMRLSRLPFGTAKIIASLTGNRRLRFAVELFEGFAAIGEEGDGQECEALLGTSRTTLAQWLQAQPPAAAVPAA